MVVVDSSPNILSWCLPPWFTGVSRPCCMGIKILGVFILCGGGNTFDKEGLTPTRVDQFLYSSLWFLAIVHNVTCLKRSI